MKDNALQLECGLVHTAKKDDEIKMPESAGKQKLRQWLNKNFRITMTDGRVLIGVFVCTDRDANIILGSCSEFLSENSDLNEERVLGLVMVPGRHIVSIQFDDLNCPIKRENTQDCNGEGVDHSTEII